MKTLRDHIAEAENKHTALGHFNIGNIEGLWAIARAAKAVGVPVIIGVSEGERDFLGVRQVRALVTSVAEQLGYPIFLNADHTYSLEKIKEAVDAGFDCVIIDGAKLSFEENVKITKEAVEYARAKNPHVLVEGEIGYIGQSSQLLETIPPGVALDPASLTSPEEAKKFVSLTGIDLLAPAVGNIHGMLKGGDEPSIDVKRVAAIRGEAGIPLVLHGGSGNSDEDFLKAIKAGISIIHINTELRVAFRDAVKKSLQDDPDEVAPYKIMKPAVQAMQKLVEQKLKLFSGLS
ncbi:class II fructose-bisphosphate aldolase [Patescibacteria group bacterium]|nr:MAG: class II fructose-bisphosphate aldolase [Patescibacteria group bacterium]